MLTKAHATELHAIGERLRAIAEESGASSVHASGVATNAQRAGYHDADACYDMPTTSVRCSDLDDSQHYSWTENKIRCYCVLWKPGHETRG